MVIWAPKSMRDGHTIILYYLYWGFFRPVNVLPCTKWLQRSIGNNMNFDKYREHWSQLGAIGVEPTSIVIRVANESLSWSTPSRKSHCRPDTDGTIYLKDWTCWSFGWPEAFHTTRDSQIDGAFSTNQGEKTPPGVSFPVLLSIAQFFWEYFQTTWTYFYSDIFTSSSQFLWRYLLF